MVQIKVFRNGAVKTQECDSAVFAHPRFGERVLGRLIKDAVVMYEANRRAGTHKTKTRSEVHGPNHKLWKQKHTGRARMGTDKSPLWRGGGNIFGPRPRDYSYQLPAKAKTGALRSALHGKLRDGEIALAEGWPAEAPSTKTAIGVLRSLGIEPGPGNGVTVVTERHESVLYRSLRNVPYVDVRAVADLNAHQILLRRHLVLTPAAFDALRGRFTTAAAAATES
jgi:large subunit ribosomal protein L4